MEKLTSLPYSVVLTHGHGDHAGGCQAFDKVYLAAVDRPLVYQHGMKMRVGFAKMGLETIEQMGGPKIDFDPERDMIPEPEKDKVFQPLTDGMVFDLGGLTVEMIAFYGHTKGMTCPLIREERTILFGDACNSNTLVGWEECTTISEYLASLNRIKAMEDRYDVVLHSHGPAVGPRTCLDDNIELCEKILAGTDDHFEVDGFSGLGWLAAARKDPLNRADGKFGNIFYTELTRK